MISQQTLGRSSLKKKNESMYFVQSFSDPPKIWTKNRIKFFHNQIKQFYQNEIQKVWIRGLTPRGTHFEKMFSKFAS